MSRHDGFQHGSGNVFDCACCGRRARETNDTSGSGFCNLCYELMGIDNTINDNGLEGEAAAQYVEQAKKLLEQIGAKGGNVANVKEICSYACKGL